MRFSFQMNSLHNLYIHFLLLLLMSVPLCLGVWCFDYYYVTFPFGWKVLVFQYLAPRLLY